MSITRAFSSAYDQIAQKWVRAVARAAQRPHLRYCFCAMGRIAKSTGRVQQTHINYAERVMKELGLTGANRKAAIGWFDEGKKETANFHLLAAACNKKPQPLLTELVLECLVQIARIEPSAAANRSLTLLTSLLNIDNNTLTEKQTLVSQDTAAINEAHRILGVELGAQPQEVKAAYRALASRYHPDKLGPDATEKELQHHRDRSVEIRAAYELLLRR